jgi:rubrerythrin
LFSFSEVIDLAVQIEKNGEQTYLAAIDHIEDPGLKQLLEWIAQEERHHAKWFADLKVTAGILDDDESLKEMNETLVRDYLGDQTFSLKEVDFNLVKDSNELIRIFIEFEKDTILFYDILIAFVPDEATKDKISHIIAEEETHIEKFRELLDPESEHAKGYENIIQKDSK